MSETAAAAEVTTLPSPGTPPSHSDSDVYLAHERFIKEVLRLRSTDAPKPLWRVLFESPGFAAVLTVFVGGVFTTIITNSYQASLKDREFRNELVKAYAESQLMVARSDLDGRIKTLTAALELVGKTYVRAQDRIAIDGPLFAHRRSKDADRLLEQQKATIRKQFNDAWSDWDSRKHSTGKLVAYYFTFENQWSDVQQALDAYLNCANTHVAHDMDVEDPCSAADNTIETTTRELGKLFRTPPASPWLTREHVDEILKAIPR